MTCDDFESIGALLEEATSAVNAGSPAMLEGLLDFDARMFFPGVPVIVGRTRILYEIERNLASWRYDLVLHCTEIICESALGFCSGTIGLRSLAVGAGAIRYTDGKFVAVVHKGPAQRWRLHRICYNTNLPDAG